MPHNPQAGTTALAKWNSSGPMAIQAQAAWREATQIRIAESACRSGAPDLRSPNTSGKPVLCRPAVTAGTTVEWSRPLSVPTDEMAGLELSNLTGASKMRLMCALLDYGKSELLNVPMNEMRRAFNAVDTDGTGLLDLQEIKTALSNLGEHVASVSGAKLLYDALNRGSETGGVTYNSFVVALSEYKAFATTANQVLDLSTALIY